MIQIVPLMILSQIIDVIDGKFNHMFDKIIIVDCRYPYEYVGGHVPGAVNINTLDAAERFFFNEPPAPDQHVMVVFHCEFSSERAPRMYQISVISF